MKKIIVSKTNTDSELYSLAKVYVKGPCSPTYEKLKNEILKMEGLKEPNRPVFLSKDINK